MKIRLLVLLLFSHFSLFANRIDGLKTTNEVERFVISLDTTIQKYLSQGHNFRVMQRQELIGNFKSANPSETAKINSWEKIDLNGDGRTDLLVHANWFNNAVFVVMDLGADQYKVYRIRPHGGDSDGQVAIPIRIGKQVCLLLNGKCCLDRNVGYCKDTLVYKAGAFVEYEAHPAVYDIKQVTFTAGGCPMGQCLRYKIQINADRSARYVASSYIPDQGVFTGTIPPQISGQLKDLLNYIRIKKIQHKFEDCGVMDAAQWWLEVIYKDGTKTQYRVYAEQAPYGLLAIEDLFAELRQLPNWEKIK